MTDKKLSDRERRKNKNEGNMKIKIYIYIYIYKTHFIRKKDSPIQKIQKNYVAIEK